MTETPEARLTAFLTARMAEAWSAARDRELATGTGGTFETRAVDAMRAIVNRCVTSLETIGSVRAPRAGLARKILYDLAAIWDSHPDHDPGWKA